MFKKNPSYLCLQAALITDTEQFVGGTNEQPAVGDGDWSLDGLVFHIDSRKNFEPAVISGKDNGLGGLAYAV